LAKTLICTKPEKKLSHICDYSSYPVNPSDINTNVEKMCTRLDSLTATSVLAGTKIVLSVRYLGGFYIGMLS
jgi:hypothetical protein